MGEVLDISTGQPVPPPLKRSCYVCRHAMFGERGTFCAEFSELIMFEDLAAADCEVFEIS